MSRDHVTECAVAAMLGAPMPPAPCCHLADCDEPAPNLMPDPCPNCGRWYVNDDNSVEPETYDGRRRRVARAVYGPDRMKVPPYRPGMHDHISRTTGSPGSGQPRPRATQQGAATPGHGATAQGAAAAAGNVAEPQLDPVPDRAERPSSSTFSLADLAMPRRKEWDAEAHDRGDTSESDGYETADYVDGWNEALDAAADSGAYGAELRAAIIKLLDSDATAGQLRAELALHVGR